MNRGIPLFEVDERIGKSVNSVCKKAPKTGLTDALIAVKVRKTFWFGKDKGLNLGAEPPPIKPSVTRRFFLSFFAPKEMNA